MTHSANDSAADTLSITLETLREAIERAETDEEVAKLKQCYAKVRGTRDLILEREAPTPTQQLHAAVAKRGDDPDD